MNDNKTSKNSIVAKFAVPISFLILFFLAANFTDCDLVTFWKRRSHLTDLVVDMIPPDFSYIQKILLPLFYTIQMSVTGTVLGIFFALVLSPFGAANLGFPAVIRRILRIVIQILRSFPALILALTATFLFGLGTFAGTFAITLYTFAIMTKLTYEDASAADVKAYQALRAMGVSKYVAYIHGILPEIIPGFLTNALYLLETNVRHSSILGYVGAGGIGLLLIVKISWLVFDKVGSFLLMLFLTVCLRAYAVSKNIYSPKPVIMPRIMPSIIDTGIFTKSITLALPPCATFKNVVNNTITNMSSHEAPDSIICGIALSVP